MFTLGAMALVVLLLGYILAAPDEYGRKNTFFDRNTTTAMRGFWCLVIMLVHVPVSKQNLIQDLIGSFAYIGVTFFFMTSSYGLMLAVRKSPNTALRRFWKRRLPKLLIPMFIVNLLTLLVDTTAGEPSMWTLLGTTGFVRQLIIFYFVFWVVFQLPNHWLSQKYRILTLCISVIIISLLIYFTGGAGVFGWPTESFGFLYGILLSRFAEVFVEKMSPRWVLKCILGCVATLVLGVLYLITKQVTFWGDYVVKIILGFSILSFMLCVNTRYPVGNVVGRFMGGISYEIYLIHGLVFRCIDGVAPELDSGLYIVISIVITVLLSIAVHWAGERILRRIS